jgi:hypothetical protein
VTPADFIQVILATKPCHMRTQSKRETKLEINATALTREVCDNETATPNHRDDLLVDAIHVFVLVNTSCFVAGVSYRRLDCLGPQGF